MVKPVQNINHNKPMKVKVKKERVKTTNKAKFSLYMDKSLMEKAESTYHQPRKWYKSYTFPLIPVIQYRPAKIHNTSSFSFHWLVLKFWTLDSFDFEIGIAFSGHWGIGVLGILPYLRWVISIPAPQKLSMWVQMYLWRKPKTVITDKTL